MNYYNRFSWLNVNSMIIQIFRQDLKVCFNNVCLYIKFNLSYNHVIMTHDNIIICKNNKNLFL